MIRGIRKSQSGYVLLFLVLALLGIAGVVGASFTQNVKKTVEWERYLHNEQVLKEAKQALLMYAYRYPETALAFGVPTIRGPGRLPCPDINDSGTPDPVADCETGPDGNVGRFPWDADGMDFYDARDASGERLWYAVSSNFANLDPDIINSDTSGTITIYDQAGSLLYDGLVAGVAAVIVAPGPTIDRAGTVQIRQTNPQQLDPTNYLDLFGALDNADFINLSTADGFVLGQIDNLAASTIIVNDQIILVTVDEVAAIAGQATLQAYRTAIDEYRANISVDAYPWLDDYITTDLTRFDADINTRIGRVPSIFATYFAENGFDSQPIDSELRLEMTFIGASAYLNPEFSFAQTLPGLVTNLQFTDIASPPVEELRGSLAPAFTPTVIRYYWEEITVPDGFEVWKLCPAGGDDLTDCNRDALGVFTPGLPNLFASKVREVTLSINIGANFQIGLDYAVAPTLSYIDPDAALHAEIRAQFTGDRISGANISLLYDQDDFYFNSFDPDDILEGQEDIDILNAAALVTLGGRYYPELPRWALDNDWHNSIQMAYAAAFQPGVATLDCVPATDCLTVNNIGGITDDKRALLVLASEHDLLDDDDNAVPIPAAAGYTDELDDIFDAVNNYDVSSDIFDAWSLNGNDKVLVIR